jgi:hypothetical protein
VQLVLELTHHLRAAQRRLGEEMASRDDPALERVKADLNELLVHLGVEVSESTWRR